MPGKSNAKAKRPDLGSGGAEKAAKTIEGRASQIANIVGQATGRKRKKKRNKDNG